MNRPCRRLRSARLPLAITLLSLAAALACAQPREAAADAPETPPAAAAAVADTPRAERPGHAAGDAVEIQWQGGWYPGRILQVDGERYRISYDGYGEEWHSWVPADRLRRPGSQAAAAAPAQTATPAAAPAPRADPAAPAARRGLQGTWQYESWMSTRPGQGRAEMMNGDVFYWLTLRENGTWSLSSTTRWSPNSPDFAAGGRYTLDGGQLVLTQSGTPAQTYGRYTVQENGDRVTLREAGTGDVIVLRRGRG